MTDKPTSAQARHYIANFAKHVMPGTQYVDFPDGRIFLNRMKDDEAVKVAIGLMEIEAKAEKGADAMTDILPAQSPLKPVKTLNGKFDARCHVCWNAVYVLWIDNQDPAGRCPFGHTVAHQCTDAMGRAHDAAGIIKLKQQGLIR